MKKSLLIISIIILVAGVLAVLMGLLFMYVSKHTLDGSFSLYTKQRRVMAIHLISGAVTLAVGIVALVWGIRNGNH